VEELPFKSLGLVRFLKKSEKKEK